MPHVVLLIDDSVPFHKLVKAYLEPDKLSFHSAYNGEAGLAAAALLMPSLILLDVDMPGMDGFEVCRRLKANPLTSSIPVIFLTANAALYDKVSGLELGASDYISKPFKPEQFRARVRASLRTKENLDANSLVDSSTGLWNRAYLNQHVGRCVSLAKRFNASLAAVVAGIDDYPTVINSHDPPIVVEVVRAVARILVSQCRTEDIVCRFDESKFAILVTGANRAGGAHVADRLRKEIERQMRTTVGRGTGLTCSFGVSDTHIADAATLIARADAGLQDPLQTGPGRIVVARAAELFAAG